jgi:ATP-binding cassette subfamily F protein 3
MITLHNIGIEFQGIPLFKNISWSIGDNARIGLIGANGSGKTTLLRIIAGEINPDEGTVVKDKKSKIGYLPQENVTFLGRTLYEEMLSVFESVNQLFETKKLIEAKFSKLDHNSLEFQELLEKYGEIEEKINKIDGYNIENRIEKILNGLGFSHTDWHKPTETFSGGWEMRIALGKLLLQDPDCLLLDEPTNFLDIESIVWLEKYLKGFQGSIILVSHDRYFMDRLINKIAEIEFGKLTLYSTNYSGYIKEKEKRREIILKAYKNQQKEIARIKLFIEKFRANAKRAKLVKSREKMLSRMKIITLPPNPKKIKFRFSPIPRSGDKVLELKNVSKSYGTKKVFENISLLVRRGERIAIIGANGKGKTTLAKILAGVLEPTKGERKVGTNVQIGYFAQRTLEMLNPENTVLEELQISAPQETEDRLRTFLGAFLFSDDDVFKYVKVLSGGEKTRLAIAKILINPVNLLILDEPTNHLDLTGRQVLESALKEYTGTIILITHDRSIIDSIANKVIEVDKGTIETYLGNYTDYINSKEKKESSITKKVQKNKIMREKNKLELSKKCKELEKKIEKKENKKRALESLFLGKSSNFKRETAIDKYNTIKKELEALYEEREELLQKLGDTI